MYITRTIKTALLLLLTANLFASSQDSTAKFLRVIDYEGKRWMLMDLDTARSRALLIDKGFEYFKLYAIEKKARSDQDSINSLLHQTISDKDLQLSNQKQMFYNSEKKAMNNLDLAHTWRLKARGRSFKIVIVGAAGVVVGYLIGN